jgi:hypothetical protein
MTHSDTITDLLTALCAARLEFPTITRNREGFSKRTCRGARTSRA